MRDSDNPGFDVKTKRAVCRVVFKVGKVCAIKVGMGSKDRAMEEDNGFGFGVWGVA